jgi:hypothetical protein
MGNTNGLRPQLAGKGAAQLYRSFLSLRPNFMIKRLVWFFFLGAIGFSCLDEPDCYSLNNNVIGISFKKMSDGKADTVFFSRIWADGTNRTFVENSLITGNDTLPLNYYANETVFHFEGLGRSFELPVKYSAKTQLVSEECGERFVLTGMSIDGHTFDSVRVLSRTPKRSDGSGTHFEIYRCPNRSQVKLRFASGLTITSISTNYSADILYSDSQPTTVLTVPLNVGAGSSTINFQFSDGSTRSITIGHLNGKDTLFNACGEQDVLSELSVITTNFSSHTIVNASTQDPPVTNIALTF